MKEVSPQEIRSITSKIKTLANESLGALTYIDEHINRDWENVRDQHPHFRVVKNELSVSIFYNRDNEEIKKIAEFIHNSIGKNKNFDHVEGIFQQLN